MSLTALVAPASDPGLRGAPQGACVLQLAKKRASEEKFKNIVAVVVLAVAQRDALVDDRELGVAADRTGAGPAQTALQAAQLGAQAVTQLLQPPLGTINAAVQSLTLEIAAAELLEQSLQAAAVTAQLP